MFEEVDVEVDGGAEDGEEVGDLAHLVGPLRPEDGAARVGLRELPDVGNPPDSVTQDEDWPGGGGDSVNKYSHQKMSGLGHTLEMRQPSSDISWKSF